MINEKLNQLYLNYCDNKLSHSFLIETNNMDKCLEEILLLLSKIECENNNSAEKCLNCNKSELIKQNKFPGLIIVRPDGNVIKKDQIDYIKSSFAMKPTYSKYNTYIILHPELMNSIAFNRLLKFLEEPEDNILAFFVSENINFVPATIISRCEIIKSFYEKTNDIYIYEDYIKKYQKYINDKNLDILWYNENELLNILKERQQVILFLKELLHYYLKDSENNLIKQHVCLTLNKYIKRIGYNVNISLFINSFAIELINYE